MSEKEFTPEASKEKNKLRPFQKVLGAAVCGSVLVGGIFLWKMKAAHTDARETLHRIDAFVADHPFVEGLDKETAEELPQTQHEMYDHYHDLWQTWYAQSEESNLSMGVAIGAAEFLVMFGAPLIIVPVTGRRDKGTEAPVVQAPQS